MSLLRPLRVLLLISMSLTVGCTRELTKNHSTLSVQMPSASALLSKAQSLSLDPSMKPCFGVQITGPGIATSQPNSCAPAVGVTGGFVAENQTISLLVPRGEKRVIELLVFMAAPEETCPQWNQDTLSGIGARMRTFRAGLVSDVNVSEPEMTVTMTVDTSNTTPIGSQTAGVCIPTPQLRGVLTNTGDVLDPTGTKLPNLSLPNYESFYLTEFGGELGIGRISSSGVLNPGMASEVQTPPWLRSLTRKPDLGLYYALDDEGQIHQVKLANNAVTDVVQLTGTTCPFSVPDCKVPPWMQSISAGFADQLFAIDHDGQVYELDSVPMPLSTNLGPFISQFAFY